MLTCFISYSRRDIDKVTPIVQSIERSNYKIWFDTKSIVGGEEWEKALSEGIKKSDVVIFFTSLNSIESKWCERELILATHDGKVIIPIIIEHAELPANLAKLQYVDMTDSKDNFPRIIEALNVVHDKIVPNQKTPLNSNGIEQTITVGDVTSEGNVTIGGINL